MSIGHWKHFQQQPSNMYKREWGETNEMENWMYVCASWRRATECQKSTIDISSLTPNMEANGEGKAPQRILHEQLKFVKPAFSELFSQWLCQHLWEKEEVKVLQDFSSTISRDFNQWTADDYSAIPSCMIITAWKLNQEVQEGKRLTIQSEHLPNMAKTKQKRDALSSTLIFLCSEKKQHFST